MSEVQSVRRAIPLREILRPVYLGGGQIPPVAVLAVYLDDSTNGDVFALAGYIASVRTWDVFFTPAWKRMLDKAPHVIAEYHAADCESGFGEFREAAGWSKDQRHALTRTAVEVVATAAPPGMFFGFGVAVQISKAEDAPGFEGLPAGDKTRLREFRRNEVYKLCAQLALTEALVWADVYLKSKKDRLEIIMDRPTKQTGNTKKFFEELVEQFAKDAPCQLETPIFRDSKGVLPLQAADLLAYETAKELVNASASPRVYPMRRSLKRLIEARYHHVFVVDMAHLAEYRGRETRGEPHEGVATPVLFESPPGVLERLSAAGERYRRYGWIFAYTGLALGITLRPFYLLWLGATSLLRRLRALTPKSPVE